MTAITARPNLQADEKYRFASPAQKETVFYNSKCRMSHIVQSFLTHSDSTAFQLTCQSGKKMVESHFYGEKLNNHKRVTQEYMRAHRDCEAEKKELIPLEQPFIEADVKHRAIQNTRFGRFVNKINQRNGILGVIGRILKWLFNCIRVEAERQDKIFGDFLLAQHHYTVKWGVVRRLEKDRHQCKIVYDQSQNELKSWFPIHNLFGGEKTLETLAIPIGERNDLIARENRDGHFFNFPVYHPEKINLRIPQFGSIFRGYARGPDDFIAIRIAHKGRNLSQLSVTDKLESIFTFCIYRRHHNKTRWLISEGEYASGTGILGGLHRPGAYEFQVMDEQNKYEKVRGLIGRIKEFHKSSKESADKEESRITDAKKLFAIPDYIGYEGLAFVHLFGGPEKFNSIPLDDRSSGLRHTTDIEFECRGHEFLRRRVTNSLQDLGPNHGKVRVTETDIAIIQYPDTDMCSKSGFSGTVLFKATIEKRAGADPQLNQQLVSEEARSLALDYAFRNEEQLKFDSTHYNKWRAFVSVLNDHMARNNLRYDTMGPIPTELLKFLL